MSDEKKHPLEETFDLPESDELTDELFKLNIPDNPSLDDIAKIALTAYSEHMADISHMEPKFRARNLEVAQLFLKLANEALGKKEDVRIKDDKLEFDKDKSDTGEGGEKKTSITRKEILMELNKKVKAREA